MNNTEALAILTSKVVDTTLTFRLLGWMQSQARMELNGLCEPKTVALSLAEFVESYEADIRSLPDATF